MEPAARTDASTSVRICCAARVEARGWLIEEEYPWFEDQEPSGATRRCSPKLMAWQGRSRRCVICSDAATSSERARA